MSRYFIAILLVLLLVSGVSAQTNCPGKSIGDANCDGSPTLADYQIWRTEFKAGVADKADFNNDGKPTLVDYQIWRTNYKNGTTISPTITNAPPSATPPPGGARMLGGSSNPNDKTAYPETLPLPGPRPIPSGGVAIAAGQSIQDAINSNPEGTQFNLAQGTWQGNNNQITPKQGNSFYGVAAGKTIISGYTIRGGGDNVTIANMTIQGYTGDTHGAIENNFDSGAGQGWKVQNNEIKDNVVGLVFGSNSLIEHNYIHDNSAEGAGGGGGDRNVDFKPDEPPNGSIFRYNALIHNDRGGIPDEGASFSGFKSGDVFYFEVYGNYMADNGQSGMWCDVYCGNNHFYDNISVRNSMNGFMDEIGYGGTIIENNIALGNGWRNADWQDVGILISSTGKDIVRNNIALNNRDTDIQFYCQDRGVPCINNEAYGNTTSKPIGVESQSVNLHDNTVVDPNQFTVPKKAVGPQM